jgi:signal transduction histidine kinase
LSHDLRQPLQALTLLTSALRKLSKDAGLTEALKEQERAIGAASGLLNSLLDLHKLESGSRQPSFDDFGSAELLDEVRTEFAESAARKGLRLQFETCGESARSDRILVGQILRNLVSNAIRYTAAGCVRVRCSPEGDNLRLEVIDTGIGIPADAVPHIFDEFYQVSDAAGREGHGIGLSIAHRIARLLDLEIGVRSKLGNGSIFTLVLPRGCGPLC